MPSRCSVSPLGMSSVTLTSLPPSIVTRSLSLYGGFCPRKGGGSSCINTLWRTAAALRSHPECPQLIFGLLRHEPHARPRLRLSSLTESIFSPPTASFTLTFILPFVFFTLSYYTTRFTSPCSHLHSPTSWHRMRLVQRTYARA